MKKKLLFILSLSLFCLTNLFSQTKIWDFGNDATTWPLSSGIGNSSIIVDNLGLYPIPTNTNFGAVTASSASFSDGFTAPRRFQLNGGGGVTAPVYMPTQRYLFMDVSGACTVKVWFKTGSNGSVRTIFVTDGTSLVGSASSNANGEGDLVILTANYTGGAGRLYVYGDNACNLYKMEVTGATVNTLSSDSFELVTSHKVFSNGKKVFLSEITTSSVVNVYGITGALIKTFNVNNDFEFDLNQGFYIVKLKSEDGIERAAKVLIN